VQSQSKSSINGNGNIQEKIILVIFSIFSFCTSILTEGKIQEEKTLPPFIREALLSECPGRDVDNVNYPILKAFLITIKNGISALGHGVLDLVGFNNSTKTSISFSQHFIERLPLSIKDSIIQNNTNILSNISVKSLINISEMHLKSGILNHTLFFMHEHHITEALYITSVIGCLFLVTEYFAGAKNLQNKQILLDADSLRQECEDYILSQKKIYSSLNENARLLAEAQINERARLLEEARVAIEQQEQLERDRLLAEAQIIERAAADRRAQASVVEAQARAVGSPISPPTVVGGGAIGGSGGGGGAVEARSVPVVTDNPIVTLNRIVDSIGFRKILSAIESDRCPQQLFVNMYPLLTEGDIAHIRKFVFVIQNSPRFFNLDLIEAEYHNGVVPYAPFKVIKGILLEPKIIFREVKLLDRKAINYATIFYIKFRDDVLGMIESCW
jgi:hypothetical protein